jgi:UDPglucose 6-dehydrogenase
VRVYDPVAMAEARHLIRGVEFKDSAEAVLEGADAVVLVTEWPEFAELDLAELARLMRGNVLIDGRNVFDPARAREAGLAYEGVGRSAGRSPTYVAGA